MCPNCGAWYHVASVHSIGSCPSCGGGGGGGSERPNPYAALEAALEQINELERQLAPLRQQKQAKRAEIAKLENALATLRQQVDDLKKTAAESKARRQREQLALWALESTLDESRKQYDERLLAVQIALAKADAVRQGRPVSSVRPSTADTFPPPVYLNEDALYKHIDPATFLTADIYAQAVKEFNRQAALQRDVQDQLAKMELWGKKQGFQSEKLVILQRKELAAGLGDLVDLLAPLPEVLKGKISAEALLKYRQAYIALKFAVAAAATKDENEFDTAMQSAVAALTEAAALTGAAVSNDDTARRMKALVMFADAGEKALLATSVKDRAERNILLLKAVATLDPWATATVAADSLIHRVSRYRRLAAALDDLADQRNATDLALRRLRDQIEALERNCKESQRIIALWEARARKDGGK